MIEEVNKFSKTSSPIELSLFSIKWKMNFSISLSWWFLSTNSEVAGSFNSNIVEVYDEIIRNHVSWLMSVTIYGVII